MSLESILDRLAGQPVIPRRKKRLRPARFHVEPLELRALLTTYTVTSLDPTFETTPFDPSHVGLEVAVNEVNLFPKSDGTPDVINFKIPGGGVQTIKWTNTLDPIVFDEPVTIDATTQFGYSAGQPMIDIDGSQAGDESGLTFNVGGNTIKGLIINNFTGANGQDGFGIALNDGNNNTIQGNFIGTDPTGATAAPNQGGGIVLRNSSHNLIGGLNLGGQLTNGNLISGNDNEGIFLQTASDTNNFIEGNYIGTDKTGLKPIANAPDTSDGVDLLPAKNSLSDGFASNNFIGDFDPNEMQFDPNGRNIISGNTANGVSIVGGTTNQVTGNYIGLGADGITPVPNVNGIVLLDASGNTVGGTQANARNVISANLNDGVDILSVATTAGLTIPVSQQSITSNVVDGNFIGTDWTGTDQTTDGQGNPVTLSLGNKRGVSIANLATDPSVFISSNIIGGQNANGQLTAGNLISGNSLDGIELQGTGVSTNFIEGNYIGTNLAGKQPLPNAVAGVELSSFAGETGPSGNFIGVSGEGNVISGNGTPALGAASGGVLIANGSNGNILEGNDIGTTPGGLGRLANVNGVVIVNAANNVVGDFSDHNVISGNTVEGVLITGSQATGNYVQNNRIGTSDDFSTPIPNQDGVVINNQASGNFVGNVVTLNNGSIALLGNTIAANTGFGVQIAGAAANNQLMANGFGIVEGLDSRRGTTLPGNGTGIEILDSASNLIGGTTANDRNYIENSLGEGVDIVDTNGEAGSGTVVTTLNVVEGNYIGVQNDGSSKLGNVVAGVFILGAAGNTIGGILPGAGNVISGSSSGVGIGYGGAQGNIVAGNDIGTSADGTTAVPNKTGIQITNGATQNYVGLAASGRNVISGNSTNGVALQGAGQSNHVQNNYIGLNAQGTAAPTNSPTTNNQTIGISVDSSPNTFIGGTDPSLRNVVSGNTTFDIAVGTSSNGTQVLGNYVGTDKDAANTVANNGLGIAVIPSAGSSAAPPDVTISGNTIGGATTAAILLSVGTGNDKILGNYIGANANGGKIPNTGSGIEILNSQGDTVSGNQVLFTQKDTSQSADPDTGTGIAIDGSATTPDNSQPKPNTFVSNIIESNQDDGIVLRDGAAFNVIGAPDQSNTVILNQNNGIAIYGQGTDNNTLQANLIGIFLTGVPGDTGTKAANAQAGVDIAFSAAQNIIGGQFIGDANVISGNNVGVKLETEAAGNSIVGNDIGTNINGVFQPGLGNGVGIQCLVAGANTIGGPAPIPGFTPGNEIVGNNVGIDFKALGAPIGSNVQGNVIANSTTFGVECEEGASNNTIGGLDKDDSNSIHDNGSDGVYIQSGSGNAILRNVIFNNAGLGIHLDASGNGNNLQVAPYLSLATTGKSNRLAGWLQNAAPNTWYAIDFFSGRQSPTNNGTENDDAEHIVPTSYRTITNSLGGFSFDVQLPGSIAQGSVIRAVAVAQGATTYTSASGQTLTTAVGDTSQFSNPVIVSLDSNGDGEPDSIEANAPSGAPAGSVTFQDAVMNPPAYVTLEPPPASDPKSQVAFQNAWSTPMPAPPDQNGPPQGTLFPLGFASFTLANTPVSPAGQPLPFVVTMILPAGTSTPTSYWRYGETPDDPTENHWYNWIFGQEPDGTGAEIRGNLILLHFLDGGFGDDDLDPNNRTIVDSGSPGFPGPYTVSTTADSGPGSLRQAILNADANPFNTITFDLPGSAPQTIQLLSPLPAITAGVTIDGSTQPGFAGTPLVVLDGSQAGAGADGLKVASGNATIQDLVINQFSGDGIHVLSGGSGLIVGNYIGTDASGKVAAGNGLYGVEIDGDTPDASDPDNDGDDDNGADGGDNDDDEHFPVPSTIDGGNVISANLAGGIFIHGAKVSGNQITNNFIGTQVDGVSPLGNGGPGVVIDGGSNFNTIGFEPNTGNTIAYNAGPGVKIGQGKENLVESNSIFANQGVGIDLAGGQNANDSQSAPVLASASSYGGQTFISGTLTSTPNSSYTIDFYATDQADALGGAQGQFLLGSLAVTTDNNGQASFDVDLAASAAPGSFITATASLNDGETSAFSAELALTATNPQVFVVNTTDDVNDANPDPTHFSLREAILAANAHPGQDVIDFDLPNSDRVIQPQSALPTITDPVIIDGTSQPGYEGLPLVELDGSQATAGADGLDITGGGSVVRGLAIHSFQTGTDNQGNTIDGHGIEISGQGGNILEGDFIGTDVTGTRAQPDQGYGEVYIFGSPDNTIGGTTAADRNVTPFVLIEGYDAEAGQPLSNAGGNRIEGNYIGTDLTGTAALSGANQVGITMDVSSGNTIGGTKAGAGNLVLGTISIFDASSNVVQGNLIGTNYEGTAALPVGAGVKISGQGFAAQYNLVGGNTPAARNIIVGTVDIGGKVGTYNQVEGNYIGTDITGTFALGPGTGVTIESAFNTIGGTEPGQGNLISGNAGGGISLSASANNNVIQGNYIGTDGTGTKALGNGGFFRNSAVVSNGYANTIGGTTPGAGNLISGNTGSGVVLGGNFTPDTVEGNLIGTDVTGTLALGNQRDGIDADESGAIIGGSPPGAGNIISGNAGNGLVAAGGASIQGNYIGTDVTGRLPLGNGGDGIYIGGPSQNDILGGSLPGAGNLIANNGGDGILFVDQPAEADGQNNPIASSGAIIQGNKIGTDVTGTRHFGNAGDGISFITSYAVATNETIGGADPGAGNLIAFNGGRGVDIPFGNGNAVRGNDIFDNGGLGLITDINGALSTYAEQRGIDLPYTAPVLTSAVFDPQGTVVSGSLSGTPFTRYEIDFFANDAVNPSGFGDGQTYLQSISVLVDETGSVQFQIPLDDAVPIGQWITATATPDTGDGNTSEFSQPAPVVAAAGNTIQFASPKYLVTETGGAAVIVVTRSGSTSGTVTVNYNTNDGSATAGINYTAESGMLTFADGVTSQTITVPVQDDGLADGDKDFQIVLSNASGASLGAVSDADVTIAEGEAAGQIQFSSSSYSVDKALANAVFTISRTGGSQGTVSVDFRVTGGTGVGVPLVFLGEVTNADYIDDFGTVTFAPGQTTAQITVGYVDDLINGINGDPQYRGPRSVELTLGNPAGGATLGAITSSTLTFDDPEDQVGEFAVYGSQVEENAGKAQIGVQRYGNLESDVSVGYTTVDGTAKAGTNYVATSGFVEFKPGQSQAFITIPILDDHIVDDDGTFQFELTTASAINIGTTIPIFPSLSQATVTILDTDGPPPAARFEVATNQSFDGYSGRAQVTVDRFDNTSGTDQIHYATSDGTAQAGTDYQSVSGTLTFLPGQKSLTFSVPLLAANTRVPGDEAFDVTLSDPVSVSDPTLGATIDPNNPVPVTLVYNTLGPAQFVSPIYPVADNSAELTVTVAGPAGATVNYATHDGTAVAGTDYTTVSGALTFGNSGLTTISIPILNDLVVGGDKTFSLILSNPQLGLTLGNVTTTTILILDENPAATAPSTTKLTSDAASGSTYGQTVTLTATVSAASGTPTGFVDSTTGEDLGSEQLAVVNGVDDASVTVSSLVAGSHTIVATYTSDNNGIAGSHDSLMQIVAPAMLTVTADNQTMAYGGTVPTLTDTIAGFVNGDPSSVVTGRASLSTTATSASGVGNYTITIGAGTLSTANYTFDFVNGSLSVTPATLTVTADDKTKVDGTANPPLTDSITGFVNGDTSSVVSGTPALTTTATSTSPAGSYPIVVGPGTLSAANYTFALVNGTLTVTAGSNRPLLTLVHDTLASATEGSSTVLTTALLQTTDSDDSVGASTIVYTITAAPTLGTLLDNGNPVVKGGSFSQQDIDDGSVTYQSTEEGADSFAFKVASGAASPLTGTLAITASDPAVVATGGFTYSATEGTLGAAQAVATFTDPGGPEALADYADTIDWGDGTSATAGTLSVNPNTHVFTVSGAHTYGQDGTFPVTVMLTHESAPTVTVTSTAGIASATGTGEGGITAAGLSVSGYEFTTLTGVTLATFTDADASLTASDFSAVIEWGDGTTSAGSVRLASDTYAVMGAHEYLDEGHYTIGVSIEQTAGQITGGTSATVSATATIHEQRLADGTVGTPDQKYIQEIYRDLFDRQAEMQGLDYWVAELAQGVPRQQVAFQMVKIASFEEFQHDTVAALYEQYLGRVPDAGGLAYWSAYLYDGGTIAGMSQALVSSQEYWQSRGGGTADGFLNALFRDALGRQIEPAALTYFEGWMSEGASAADVAVAVFSSDEYHRLRVNSFFEQFLDRPADAGALAYFAGELDNGERDEIVISQLLSSDEYYEHVQI